MKKILIIGPIGDFGGREIEADIIIKSIKKNYDVFLFSTSFITNKSFAVKNLRQHQWDSAYNLLSKNKVLKLTAFFSKYKAKSQKPLQNFISNNLSKSIYNLDRLILKEIKNQIKHVDNVILLVNLKTKFLKEILEYCQQLQKPSVIRTISTIGEIDVKKFYFLKKASIFIHHSENNVNRLNKQIPLPYKLIDQCAVNEKKLLDLDIKYNSSNLKFGYIGRFENGKGLLELINFFKLKKHGLLIAGKGSLYNRIINDIENQKNIDYIGEIKPDKISLFFKKIDVLIISSFAESGPLTGIEAMAAGKLIISTDVGAMKNRMVGLKSFFFDINNFESLNNQINNICKLSPNQKKEIAKTYREKYIKEYSFSKIKQQYKDTINSLN